MGGRVMGDVTASAARRAGARAPGVAADVGVPLFQALATGALVGAPVGAAAAWATGGPWWLAPAGMAAVSAAAWGWLLVDHRRLLWTTERVIGADLDRDGRLGPPQVVRLEVMTMDEAGRTRQVQILEIPGISQEQLREFARAVTQEGRGLAVNYWTGTGKLFTRSQYETVMAELIRAGLVREAGRFGRELSAAGRGVLRRVAGG